MNKSNTGKIIAIGAIIFAFIGGIIALIIWVSVSTPTTTSTSISNKPTPPDKGGPGTDPGGSPTSSPIVPTGTCSCPGGTGGIAPMQCKDTPCIKCNPGYAMLPGNVCKRQCGGNNGKNQFGQQWDRTCEGVAGYNRLSTCCADPKGDMRCCGRGCGRKPDTCHGE